MKKHERPYTPHHAVTSHEWCAINTFFRDRVVNNSSVLLMIRFVKDWKRMTGVDPRFRVAVAAIEWDLITSYGVEAEELKP